MFGNSHAEWLASFDLKGSLVLNPCGTHNSLPFQIAKPNGVRVWGLEFRV